MSKIAWPRSSHKNTKTRTLTCIDDVSCSRPSVAGRSAERSLLIEFLLGGADLLVDVCAIDGVAVAGERARERGDCLVEASELQQHFAIVFLDYGVGVQLLRCAAQALFGEVELVGLEVGPPEAVEKRPVVRLELQRLLHERHRLVEALAPLREHVAEIVQRRGVLGVARQPLSKR